MIANKNGFIFYVRHSVSGTQQSNRVFIYIRIICICASVYIWPELNVFVMNSECSSAAHVSENGMFGHVKDGIFPRNQFGNLLFEKSNIDKSDPIEYLLPFCVLPHPKIEITAMKGDQIAAAAAVTENTHSQKDYSFILPSESYNKIYINGALLECGYHHMTGCVESFL